MLAVLCTNSPSYSQEVDWGRKSALLEQEMTEQQVMQAVGYRPNKVPLDLLKKFISAIIAYGPKNKTKKARMARKAARRKKLAAIKRH